MPILSTINKHEALPYITTSFLGPYHNETRFTSTLKNSLKKKFYKWIKIVNPRKVKLHERRLLI